MFSLCESQLAAIIALQHFPREYAFSGDSVHIKKVDGIVMLIPKGAEWDVFERGLEIFSDDFMAGERVQGNAKSREPFD